MPAELDRCRTEIEQLHAFFVDWYCGDESAFERVERALAPSFERVSPDGTVQDREATLNGIRATQNAYEWFDIEIRNVVLLESFEESALVRYEEYQTMPGDSNGRLSTTLLAHDSDGSPATDLRWRYLQETWLEE